MSEHLTSQLIERFRHTEESYDDIILMQAHTKICTDCREHFWKEVKALERLEAYIQSLRQVSFEQDHLEQEVLQGYVNGKLDYIDRELAEAHLECCRSCGEDLNRISQLAP